MSKLLSNVLDKVSENNNDYRVELKNLNKLIDEKTTSLVGDIVTLSNYTVDFSNAVTSAKERLVNPISRTIESYAIKDLRSVETVNEQFVDKINDKIENANITTKEEKDNFIGNLNTLLNDKYLEIVRIKRVGFTSIDGTNQEIEDAVLAFNNYLKETSNFSSDKLEELLNSYKKEIYYLVSDTFDTISSLYLNNFVSEVSSALSSSIDYEDAKSENVMINEDSFRPYIPEIPAIPEVDIPNTNIEPIISEVPEVPSDFEMPVINEDEEKENDSYEYGLEESSNEQIIPEVQEQSFSTITEEIPVIPNPVMDIPSIAPIEIVEQPVTEQTRKLYDVDEILKIAKSPIVTMPQNEKNSSSDYLSVDLIKKEEEKELFNAEFDEKEIVEEMISRLTKRLQAINERQEMYDEEKNKLEEDEAFVNDLIESANNKRLELDKFEKELDAKEKEIEEKQKELDKKLNDVLPFANAIMKDDKKEA